jgi:hypothetical protein
MGLIQRTPNYASRPGATLASPALSPDTVGLYYDRARWYDPVFGRFCQRDMNATAAAVMTALVTNGQSAELLVGAFSSGEHFRDGANLYAYERSNPINRLDSDGLNSWDDSFAEAEEIMSGISAERAAAGAAVAAQVGMMFNTTKFLALQAFQFMPGADAVNLMIAVVKGETGELTWVDYMGAALDLAGPLGKITGRFTGMAMRYAKASALKFAHHGDRLLRAIGISAIEKHHLIPIFLGGWARKGATFDLPALMHSEFHDMLYENLKAAGFALERNASSATWKQVLEMGGSWERACDVLMETTQQFDRSRGMNMFASLLDELARQGWR